MSRHNKTCSRCGAPYDAPNLECITCRRRTNQQRRRRGESKPRPRRTPKPPKTTCHQCGGPLENRTRGCRTCYQRHYYRKQKDGQNNGKNLTSEQLNRDPGLATFIETAAPAEIHFTVTGRPHPKARPRFTQRGKKIITYTPQTTVDAEHRIIAAWRKATGGTPQTNPHTRYKVTLRFILPDRRRVDLDNLTKTVLDALSRRAWADDTQIYQIHAQKYVLSGANPVTQISIQEIRS